VSLEKVVGKFFFPSREKYRTTALNNIVCMQSKATEQKNTKDKRHT